MSQEAKRTNTAGGGAKNECEGEKMVSAIEVDEIRRKEELRSCKREGRGCQKAKELKKLQREEETRTCRKAGKGCNKAKEPCQSGKRK